MCPEIQIDDEVFAYLQKHGKAFVDQPNDVLRRLLLNASRPASGGAELAVSRKPIARATDSGAKAAARKRGKSPRSRASSDELLAETEYEIPILFVLERAGGRVPTSEVVAAVGQELADKFMPMDLEVMENGRHRWEMRTQFARLHMVKNGLLESEAPRGVWAISDEGRVRLSKAEAVAA